MKVLLHLIKGEIHRLIKYKTMVVGFVVSFLWVLIIWLSDKESAEMLIPLLIFVDAAMMSILLLGASFYLEKQEEVTKTLMVTPIQLWQLLFAKVVASLVSGVVSTIFVVMIGIFIHGVEIALLKLLVAVILIIISHTAIGYLISLYAKDFSTMIIRYAMYALIFFLPSILVTLGVFQESLEWIVMLSPSHSGQVLINGAFDVINPVEWWVGLAYLFMIGLVIYPVFVYPKYKKVSLEV